MTTRTEKWNPLDYQCGYRCTYCPEQDHSRIPKLVEDRMPSHFAVWVAEGTDIFCDEVPSDLISNILEQTRGYPGKSFLFCTKNPARYFEFIDEFPSQSYFISTVESDIDYKYSTAPSPKERLEELAKLKPLVGMSDVCISIQPILEFTDDFVELIRQLNPDQVSIGNELTGLEGFPTPEFYRAMWLAQQLSEFSMVNINEEPVNEHTILQDWPFRELKPGYYKSPRWVIPPVVP